MSAMLYTTLKIPESIKSKLREPLGKIVRDKELEDILRKAKRVVVVGDFATLSLLEIKPSFDICIVDLKTKRNPLSQEQLRKIEEFPLKTHRVKNPAGHITKEAWNIIKKCLENDEKAKIIVDGEEDLLALPAILHAREGDVVLYGQPDEGIVVVEINSEIKRKVTFLLRDIVLEILANNFKDFLSKLKLKKVTLLFHPDADGCSAAAIAGKTLKMLGIEVSYRIPRGGGPKISLRDGFKILEEDKPDLIIIQDLGNEFYEVIAKMANRVPIAIIDHHVLHGCEDFGKAKLFNPHIFIDVSPPASLVSYFLFRKIKNVDADWIAAIGVVGDKEDKLCEDFLASVYNKYGLTYENFLKLACLIDAGEACEDGGYKISIDALLKANDPKDILEAKFESARKLHEYRRILEEEIKRMVEKCEKEYKLLEGKIMLCEVDSKYHIRGDVANILQERYPDRIIITYKRRNGKITLSARARYANVNLAEAIRKAITGFKNCRGGGHARAAGAEIQEKDFDVFLRRFVSYVS